MTQKPDHTTSISEDRSFMNAVVPMIDLGEVFTYIAENFDPERVYGEGPLIEWAESHGYVKEE